MKHAVTLMLFFAATALAACATRESYEGSLNGWIGHPPAELASVWGPPTSTHDLSGGGTVLTYDKQRSRVIPTGALTQPPTIYVKGTPTDGGPEASYGASTGYIIRTSPALVVMGCVTTFTTDSSGVIRSWTAEGNDCVS